MVRGLSNPLSPQGGKIVAENSNSKCMNCGKEIPDVKLTCSPACSGALGGRAKVKKGFAVSGLAREAGRKGGSSRGRSANAKVNA